MHEFSLPMLKRYIQHPVGEAELHSLVLLSAVEEEAFFRRNPHLNQLYRSRLIATALCQGAALQYLGKGYGVNDFDVHFFYLQNPDKPRLSRAIFSRPGVVGAFRDIRVDFIRTVVPCRLCSGSDSPAELISNFLKERPTSNAYNLSTKAVIGLSPASLFGVQLWPIEN